MGIYSELTNFDGDVPCQCSGDWWSMILINLTPSQLFKLEGKIGVKIVQERLLNHPRMIELKDMVRTSFTCPSYEKMPSAEKLYLSLEEVANDKTPVDDCPRLKEIEETHMLFKILIRNEGSKDDSKYTRLRKLIISMILSC
jgi:hypothetical protein